MPLYPPGLISEVCAANDILDFVSDYVSLKKSGNDYSGLCPFHSEKTPSFHVSREKQLFHCFGCGASGNIIQFIMRTENLDFTDALKILADKAGIILPEEGSAYNDEIHKKRQRLFDMNKKAARFFFNHLTHSDEGKTALRYLFDRKLSPDTIKTYGLGYAPSDYGALSEFLKREGFTEQEITEGSLAVKKDSHIRDKFRERVMFPIINTRGEIIGFGGRIINSNIKDGYKRPKYLNSGETLVFNKGKNIFSLNIAKNSKKDSVILCEGYMDVISVFQAGIKNIAASLGTALTADQVKLLSRYFKTVYICYDSDEAGQAATMRAIDTITASNSIKAKVIRLKNAKDPDEFIKTYGLAAFQKAVKDAVPATEYVLSAIKLNYDLTDTDNKIRYIHDACIALAKLPNAVERDAYTDLLCKETGISKEAVYAELRKSKRITDYNNSDTKNRTLKTVMNTSSQHTAVKVQINKTAEAEKRILNIISRDKKLASKVRKSLKPQDFSSSVYSKLADMIYNTWDSGSIPEITVLVNEFSNDVDMQNEAAAVFYNNEVYNTDNTAIDELLMSIRLNNINDELKSCRDPARIQELIKLKNQLTDSDNQ